MKLFSLTLLLCLTIPCITAKFFNVHGSSAYACILLDIDFRILVTASSLKGEKLETIVLAPTENFTVTAEGACRHSQRNIDLIFKNRFYLAFLSFKFHVDGQSVMLTRDFRFSPYRMFPMLSPAASGQVIFADPRTLNLGDMETSYLCPYKELSNYEESTRSRDRYNYSVQVEIKSIQTQAYFIHHGHFSKATKCKPPPPASHQIDMARIIVGAAAGGLLLLSVLTSLLLYAFCKTHGNSAKWNSRSDPCTPT